MKSLSDISIRQALRHDDTAHILPGIETCNATAFDRNGNYAAKILAERSGEAQTGGRDAHILKAMLE